MLHPNEIIVDNFAGGGGASTGIEMATGRSPDIAINHDPEAVAMHAANHPHTRHLCQSIMQVDPDDIVREGRPVGLAWFSPDCTHHSKARGGKPKEKGIRDLAWVVTLWAQRAKPRIIVVENVEEFLDWGPLLPDGQPCPLRKGEEFKRWVRALKAEGYKVDWRIQRACDYGAPTIRRRLFIIARRDGAPITWAEPTHGPGLIPYKSAASCIDFNLPCPSIFERKRPLVPNTLRRIAKGVFRYVITATDPFIINITHSKSTGLEPIREPMRTITTANRGEKAVIVPTLVQVGYGEAPGQQPRVPGLEKPLGTVVAGAGKFALVSATLVGAGGPEYAGKPASVDKPIKTIQTQNHTALVTAFLAQHNGGFYEGDGRPADAPMATVTARGTQTQLVASHMVKLRRNSIGGDIRDPLNTITAGGGHYGEVRAFLLKYYGTDQNPNLREPMHTLTSKDRMGLVMIHGEPWAIVDIGMRMLTARELYNAQGFPPDYIIELDVNGKPLTKTAQVRMCGNSVSPLHAKAILVEALAQKPRKDKAISFMAHRPNPLFNHACGAM